MRDIVRLCLSGKALAQRIERIHRDERAELATWERKLSSGVARIAWREHTQDFQILRSRQQLERDGLVFRQNAEADNALAREEAFKPHPEPVSSVEHQAPQLRVGDALAPQEIGKLLSDRPPLNSAFANAANGEAADRADDILRRMEAFKQRNPKHDFGRRRRR